MTDRTKKRLKTAALIVSAILITWFVMMLSGSFESVRARMWLISVVKVPLQGAALSLQDDLREGNYQRARDKVDALVEEAQNFHSGTQAFKGPGLSNLQSKLYQIDEASQDPGDPLPQLRLARQEGGSRYELRILANGKAQDFYQIGFFDQEINTRIGLAETVQSGVMSAANAAETLTALWHPSGTVVAFNDRATKHTLELYVYAIRDGTPVRLSVPDYVQNALGRLRAVETDIHCLSTPLRWTGDNLSVKLHFSVSAPGKGLTRHDALATLRLEGDRLRLHSMEGPQPAGG